MSKNKKWEKDSDEYVLHFEPYDEDIVLAVLYKNEDGEWFYKSEPIGETVDCFIGFKECCLHDAKLEVEEIIANHFEDERNYYQELLDRFIGS